MVKEGGVMSAGLQADSLETGRHGDGIEVRLSLDDKSETRPHSLPELRKLTLGLRGSEIRSHGLHPLPYPPDYPLPQFFPAQGVPVRMLVLLLLLSIGWVFVSRLYGGPSSGSSSRSPKVIIAAITSTAAVVIMMACSLTGDGINDKAVAVAVVLIAGQSKCWRE